MRKHDGMTVTDLCVSLPLAIGLRLNVFVDSDQQSIFCVGIILKSSFARQYHEYCDGRRCVGVVRVAHKDTAFGPVTHFMRMKHGRDVSRVARLHVQ